MKLRTLIEQFETMKKVKDLGSFSIYKDPSPREVREARKEDEYGEIRFIANVRDGKEVYVFPGSLLHEVAAKELGIPYKSRVHVPVWGDYAFGMAPVDEYAKLILTSKPILKDIKRYASNETKEHLRKFFVFNI